MKVVLYIILIMSLLLSHTYAEFSGKTGMNFLKIAVGARGIGMGEANTAIVDDLGALYWNPAGIGQLYAPEVYFMYNKWFEGINSQYLAGALPLKRMNEDTGLMKNLGTVAFSINYLSMDPIQGYDTTGDETNMLNASDIAISGSYGRRFYKDLYGGISLKYLSETLDDVTASAYAMDIGALMFVANNLKLGASLQNIGTGIEFVEEKGALPMIFRTGAAYRFFKRQTIVAADINMPTDNDTYFTLGGETWIKDMAALRLGYRTGIDIGSGIRAGIGFKTSLFRLDYAFAGFGDLGDTHRIGLTMRFGSGAKWDKASIMANRGEKYFEEGRYGKAILELTEVLELDPGNIRVMDMIKKAHEKMKKQEQEIE